MANRDFSVNFEGVKELRNRAAKFPDAARWAINRTIDSLFSKGSQWTRRTYAISKEDLDDRLDVVHASPGNLSARIRGRKRPFSLGRFAVGAPIQRSNVSTRQTSFVQPAKGIKVKIKKGKALTTRRTFWAWAKKGDIAEGRPALFRRVGTDRYPIKFRYALGAVDMFYTKENMGKIRDLAETKLPIELEKQIQAFFRRA
jgi:hypothetical protein